jgi:SPP1 family predicted phage head-tail adaptor
MRIDQVDLVQLSYSGTYSTESEVSRLTCWAEKLSVTRAEYYMANKDGNEVDAVFEVSPIDYKAQQRLEYVNPDGVTEKYDIKRAYRNPKKPDTTELTCERRE